MADQQQETRKTEHKVSKCPNCGGRKFVVSEGSFNGLPYLSTNEEGKTAINKGKYLPVLAYVCTECSHINFFKKSLK